MTTARGLKSTLRLTSRVKTAAESYIDAVARCAKRFGRSPDQFGAEVIRPYKQHLLERRVFWQTFVLSIAHF